MKEALDFATSTGLSSGPGHPATPARSCCWGCTESAASQRGVDETGLMATVACLDARALVDPAPFRGIVLVGLLLKDTGLPCSP